jgi:ferric-dicitrate binding protein FerR (iron transport regulator)
MMTEKIAGVISAADEVLLDHLIGSDPAVAALWRQIKSQYHQEDVDNEFQRFDNLEWKEMPFHAAQHTADPTGVQPAAVRRIRPATRAAVIAALVLAAAGGWLLRSRMTASKSISITGSYAGVQLQLADGQVLNLSKDSGVLHSGALRMINNNKTLTLPESTIHPAGDNENLTLTVPIGQYYSVRLPDGTQVALNAASTLRFPASFPAGSREVSVSGEAFLSVAKDPDRPFLVHTSQGTVQVLGTSFNVNTYDSSRVKVSLVDGMVKIKDVALKPGQQAVATNSGIRIQPFDEREELSWRQGVFYFSNTTLAEIARVLPRWFGMPVVMDNTRIASETFTGSLERNQPVTVFLDNLKSTTAVDYYFDKKGTLHFK